MTLLFLCLAAFAAGFVDAVVGGGGLHTNTGYPDPASGRTCRHRDRNH